MMIIADFQFPTYEALELATQARTDIHTLETVLFWAAIPLALIPPLSLKWKWIVLRSIVITVALWVSMVLFRVEFEVPWNRIVFDLEQTNEMYDGVGGNAALLLLGWVFPFIQSLGTLCILRFSVSLRARFQKPAVMN